uniref:Sodium symporter-related family protein n=1 Tax=Rhizophora mucronata TaxID=61149 RepID=A0A2P2JFL8_RHIMU
MVTSILLSNPISCTPRRPTYRTPCLRNMACLTFAYTLVKPNKILSPSSEFLRLKLTRHSPDKILTRAAVRDGAETDSSSSAEGLVGEDSAAFELAKQKISSWVSFCLILGVVLLVLDVAWIDNSTGYGKTFIQAVSSVSDSHEVVMLFLILIFATVHSGLASLRDMGEKLIGERAYRVLFAGVSLPLAVSTVVYFINHRYDGLQLWQLQSVPAVHQLVWLSNFISFFFLYPSTFNLLEVAAVDKPKMHLWETGIMRVTRHPQVQYLSHCSTCLICL